MRKIAIIAAMFLTGGAVLCQNTTRGEHPSAEYSEGYRDGHASALRSSAFGRYDVSRDEERYDTDQMYSWGGDDGYRSGRSTRGEVRSARSERLSS